ncbi:MAG: aldehyde dehydrogenase [Mycobacterium sp.]|nr:aldehyde dehydrogenase [Mycobacterium sp.]
MTTTQSATLFIGGRFVAADEVQPVVEAATGEPLGDGSSATESDIDDAVTAARSALDSWRSSPAAERAEVLGGFADALKKRAPTGCRWRDPGRPATRLVRRADGVRGRRQL